MTTIHDLRTYLQVLESAGQLARVHRTVGLEHELAAVAATVERQGGPALLFESVAGSRWPVFASSVANQERGALALGCEKNQVTAVMSRAIDPGQEIPPVLVEEAAWKANVLTGESVDTRVLPIPMHGAEDCGPFITSGITVSRDPVSGRGTSRTTACN